jgi:ABC-type sugar transport system ATPase subunit
MAAFSPRNDTADLLRVHKVSKAFGDTKALQSCSFTARRGEVHAIVGENGSGKSTLAKIISGVLPADSGVVQLRGTEAPRNPGHARALGVTAVYQEVLLAEGMTVLENLFIGAGPRTRRMSRAEKLREGTRLLSDLVGEPIDPHGRVDELSLGERQWITIARALLDRPQVLILDESTAALDHSGATRLYQTTARLKAEGVCVLMVTHRIEELTKFADRATVLRSGEDVGTLEGPDITEARLLELMTGDAGWTERGSRSTATAAPPPGPQSAIAVRTTGARLRPDAQAFDLDVARGEILGVIGLDGHGQTQFIQAVAGIVPPIEGSVEAIGRNGHSVSITDRKTAAKAGVAYIPGDRKLEGIFPNLSIFENFGMPLFRRHSVAGAIRFGTVRRAFDAQRDALSIRLERSSAPIGTLSGGNQQKVLIGRALAADPDIVLLNDPARGVDISTKRSLYDLLRQRAVQGNAVLFLSSEIVEFIGLCHRVAIFRNGSLFTILTGAEITVDRVLAAMFGQPGDTPVGGEEARP